MAKTVDISKNPNSGDFSSADYPLTINLSKEVKIGDTVVKSITFQDEPTADIAIYITDNQTGGMGSASVLGLERWSGMDEAKLRKFPMRDFRVLGDFMESFL